MGQDYSRVDSREMELESREDTAELDTANWMAEFGHVPFPNLIVPGSHDSGAQNLNPFATGPDWKKARGFLPLGCCVVLPWSAAQGVPPADLLEEGCRYFDLRIGIDDSVQEGEGKYRLCHGFFSRDTLDEFLTEVREFLTEHPTEAVLLEVKNVMSFEDEVTMEDHEALIAFLEDSLGGKSAFINGDNRMRPVGEVTGEGKQIYMIYCPGGWGHDTSPVDLHRDTLMPGWMIRSKWPNKCEAGPVCECLNKELLEQAESFHDRFFVLQGVMTPKTPDIVWGALCCLLYDRSLRDLARRLEPELQSLIEGANEEQLVHGAILMVDWLHEQPALVEHVIRANAKIHSQKA